MNYDVWKIIGYILGGVFVCVIAFLSPRVSAWLDANTDKATAEKIRTLCRSFARAAEQLLKADDPTGEKRYAYVIEQLQALGIAITASVVSMIEGEVWEINKSNYPSPDVALEGEGGDNA